jgi:hypothetical protein
MFYRFGKDNRFCRVLQHEQVPTILQELHNGVGGIFPQISWCEKSLMLVISGQP